MSFLSAIFLWSLPLAAIPVVIHLFHRRRRDVIGWGAMDFLLESVSRRRRFSRLDDLLLMLLRTLALLALILALAQPLVPAGWTSGGGRDVVLILDDSLSTARRRDDETVWDRVTKRAGEILDRLGERDDVRIMLAASGPRWVTPSAVAASEESKRRVRSRLSKLQPTKGTADMLACVQAAVGSDPSPTALARYVVVLTDAQAYGWSSNATNAWRMLRQNVQSSEVPTVVNVVNIDPEADRKLQGNLAVDRILATRVVVPAGGLLTLTAQVRNTGAATTSQTVLEWESLSSRDRRIASQAANDDSTSHDGRQRNADDSVPAGSSGVAESLGVASIPALEPGQQISVPIEHSFASVGTHRVKCRAKLNEELPADNEATLVIDAVDRVPILIAGRDAGEGTFHSDAGYVMAALGLSRSVSFEESPRNRSAFELTLANPEDLDKIELDRFSCIVLASTDQIADTAVESLEYYVDGGGGLWLSLGEETQPDTFNHLFYRDGEGLSPLPIADALGDADRRDEFLSIHPPSSDHPATALLGDTERLDIDDVKIYRRFPFQGGDSLAGRSAGEAGLRPQDGTTFIPPLSTSPAGDRQVAVLLEGGGGELLAIENYRGSGRVIVQAYPFGIEWSNLPLCQVYVPMLHEWLWYLTAPSFTPRNLRVHQTVICRQQDIGEDEEATMHTPLGEPVPLLPVSDGGQLAYRFRQTQLPGDYTLQRDDAPERAADASDVAARRFYFHVHRDPAESQLAQLDREQSKLISQAGVLQFVDETFDPPAGLQAETHREPIWSLLLVSMLLFMLAELLLAGWTSRRRFAPSETAPTVEG